MFQHILTVILSIQIHARVSVKTTAKLDEIQVRGSCECEDVPPPIVDVVILVDGSDSYNNKGE